jgi:hypothetical protein
MMMMALSSVADDFVNIGKWVLKGIKNDKGEVKKVLVRDFSEILEKKPQAMVELLNEPSFLKNIQTENKYINAVRERKDAVVPKARTYDEHRLMIKKRSSALSLTETTKGFTASDFQGEALNRLVTNASFSKPVKHGELLAELQGKSSAEIQTILHGKGININADKLQDSFAELTAIETGMRGVTKDAEKAFNTPILKPKSAPSGLQPASTPIVAEPVIATAPKVETPVLSTPEIKAETTYSATNPLKPKEPVTDPNPTTDKNWFAKQWEEHPVVTGTIATVGVIGTAGGIGAIAQNTAQPTS